MKQYCVTWAIDIDAETPHEAAVEALKIQRDPSSIATVFTVSNDGNQVEIDLGGNNE